MDYSITKRPHTPTPGVYMGRPTRKDDRDYDKGSGYGGRDRYYDDQYGGGSRGYDNSKLIFFLHLRIKC